jgi:hypothetical protein
MVARGVSMYWQRGATDPLDEMLFKIHLWFYAKICPSLKYNFKNMHSKIYYFYKKLQNYTYFKIIIILCLA